MKRICLFLLVFVVLGAGIFFTLYISQPSAVPPPSSKTSITVTTAASVNGGTEETAGDPATADAVSSSPVIAHLLPDDLSTILEITTTVPLDVNSSSITALVNRDYPLPSSYVPSNLTDAKIRFSFNYANDKRKLRKPAAKSIEKMFRDAEKKGIILYGVSGYRSYARQKQIYDLNVATRGRAATDMVSAKPGNSEHQTGLTMDISSRSVGYQLSQAFGNTKEGKWVAKNAHKYGFIVRYPNGKSKITGYHYEPWHIRYVGIPAATYLYKNKLTLEEYYNVSCNHSDENTDVVDVEDPDEVDLSTPKPKKKNNK